MTDLVGDIIAFETGTLGDEGILKLFGRLIESGQAWTLQGSYGRAAASLIDSGFISRDGEVQWDTVEDHLND